MTRDVAPRLKKKKPSIIHAKFFPPLTGRGGKMNASKGGDTQAVFMTDKPNEVYPHVNSKKYSFQIAKYFIV